MSPERTCIGCRATARQVDLLRLVVTDGVVVIDERRVLPGRGAYLHSDPACVATAVRRRAVTRALRAPHADTTVLSGMVVAYAKGARRA